MSVTANIITEVKTDVLSVPNSAIKSSGSVSYVQVFETPLANSEGSTGATSSVPPVNKQVTVGVSNDDVTEITGGLSEGDQVVSKTITSTATTKTTTSAISLFGGGMGGNNRNTTRTSSTSSK